MMFEAKRSFLEEDADDHEIFQVEAPSNATTSSSSSSSLTSDPKYNFDLSACLSFPGGPLGTSVRQRLDVGALEALGQLEASQAEAIATRLEQAGPSVRNPSAYVHRAVNNAKKRALVVADAPFSSSRPSLRGRLDANAVAALDELPLDTARAILDELASKAQGKVRNPSAYVVKAVGNARRGVVTGSGHSATAQLPTLGPCSSSDIDPSSSLSASLAALSVTATTTQQKTPPMSPRHHRTTTSLIASCSRISPAFSLVDDSGAFSDPPRQQRTNNDRFLSTTTTTTTRLSASPAAINPLESEATARVWSDGAARNLDSKAAAALLALPAHRAVQILGELRRKRATIRNPSAYVMRATTNAMTVAPPPLQRPQPQPPQQQPQQTQQDHVRRPLLVDSSHHRPLVHNDNFLLSRAPGPSSAHQSRGSTFAQHALLDLRPTNLFDCPVARPFD